MCRERTRGASARSSAPISTRVASSRAERAASRWVRSASYRPSGRSPALGGVEMAPFSSTGAPYQLPVSAPKGLRETSSPPPRFDLHALPRLTPSRSGARASWPCSRAFQSADERSGRAGRAVRPPPLPHGFRPPFASPSPTAARRPRSVRDGATLTAAVWKPKGDGRWPVVLVRPVRQGPDGTAFRDGRGQVRGHRRDTCRGASQAAKQARLQPAARRQLRAASVGAAP
jgi:hypothetical protein